MALVGSFGLSNGIVMDGSITNVVPFDKMDPSRVPISLINNAQVVACDEGVAPEEVAKVLNLMYGVNLQFHGYFRKGATSERNPVTGRTVRKNEQTTKLEPKGWMFFGLPGRANGAVDIGAILAKVRGK